MMMVWKGGRAGGWQAMNRNMDKEARRGIELQSGPLPILFILVAGLGVILLWIKI